MRACVWAVILNLSSVAGAFAEPRNNEVADPALAAALVGQVAGDAIATIHDRRLDRTAAQARLREQLGASFNLRYVGLLALGPYRRDMSEAELTAFEAAFGDYVLARYTALLENPGATAFRIGGVERAGSRDALVHMIINSNTEAPVEADWRVRMFGGAPQIIDISVSGLSVVARQSEEVGVWIKEAGVSGLIEHMRQVAKGDGG